MKEISEYGPAILVAGLLVAAGMIYWYAKGDGRIPARWTGLVWPADDRGSRPAACTVTLEGAWARVRLSFSEAARDPGVRTPLFLTYRDGMQVADPSCEICLYLGPHDDGMGRELLSVADGWEFEFRLLKEGDVMKAALAPSDDEDDVTPYVTLRRADDPFVPQPAEPPNLLPHLPLI